MKITKKLKGSKEYFYLRHNSREKGKIITKEKYLGKKIPSKEKLEILKKKLLESQSNELLKKLESIKNNFQREWAKVPKSIKQKELEEISIAFTYNTNAIEGSKITLEETRELLENKISPSNKPIRDVKETEAHSKLFLNILKQKPEKITKEILLEWHKNIFQESNPEIAGKFREHLVRVGEYLAPDWQDVEKLMNNFLIQLNKEPKDISIVEFCSIMHYRFEKIHPFSDGNGRIGRLLMNYLLWYNKFPMLIIPYKKRKSYYKALNKDEEGFKKYFIRYYLFVHKKRIIT